MPSPRVAFFEDLQVVPQYEHLRTQLLREEYAVHLSKPLAFWALPTDRRLPLVLMNRVLGEIIEIPFDELYRTPSIGEKKIQSLLTLLHRAVNTKAEEIPDFIPLAKSDDDPSLFIEENQREFHSSEVSEIQWKKWQQTILAWGLGHEKLGRLCPSLAELTRVIWNKTLGDYCELSLADMREIRTHGEKRINAILKIFHGICSIISKMGESKHLIVRLVPPNIEKVERWTFQVLMRRGMPAKNDVLEHYILPLVEQLRTDASEQICELAENRIGIKEDVTSIRQAARTLGLARARIYQLLNEINDIVTVRWPNGRLLTSLLRNKFLNESGNQRSNPDFDQFHAAAELFFPWGRREEASDDYFYQFSGMADELSDGFENGSPDESFYAGQVTNDITSDWNQSDDGQSFPAR